MILVDPGPIGINTTTALFAQVAIGGGFATVFTLLNTGSADLSGSLILTDSSGKPMNAFLSAPAVHPAVTKPDDRIQASSTDILIRPGGTSFITAGPANSGDPTTTGWARVESSGGTLGGVATFQFIDGGKLTTIAGVLATDVVSVATIPVDNDDSQSRFTGYAVANPSAQNINIKIVVVDTGGNSVQTLNLPQLNPLGPRQQIARFLHQDAPVLKFQGSMVLIAQAGSAFSIVALVQNQGLFTAIPVIPSKAPGIN